jgi:hypothetical protein
MITPVSKPHPVRLAARAIPPFSVALTALVLALVACGPAGAATPCWKQVQSDWTDNGRIDNTYAAACYDKAIAKLGPDLLYYSEAPDVIQAAKEQMLRAKVRLRRTAGFDPDNSHNAVGPTGTSNSNGGGGDGNSPLGSILNWGPSAADDVPLPLLIIAFLALLLMGAGAAGLVSRRMHARRLGTAGGPPTDGPTAA